MYVCMYVCEGLTFSDEGGGLCGELLLSLSHAGALRRQILAAVHDRSEHLLIHTYMHAYIRNKIYRY